MNLEAKAQDHGQLAVSKSTKIKRGMPDLHAPDPRIVKIVESWIRKHLASNEETSRFEWKEENLEFENYILTRNPPQNKDLVESQLSEMVDYRLAGNTFRNPNDAICFNDRGVLETGQHRAVAGIRAGIGSPHVVMIGPEGFANQSDLGGRITTKDKWKRQGVDKKYRTVRYGMIRLLLAIKHNNLARYFRSDAKVYEESQSYNGHELFEDAILYSQQPCPRPFTSTVTLGAAYVLIGTSSAGKGFMEELYNGTKRTSRKRNINGLRQQLARLDKLSKSRDPAFRHGDTFNLTALSAIILAWNSYPDPSPTYAWDGETLVPMVRS